MNGFRFNAITNMNDISNRYSPKVLILSRGFKKKWIPTLKILKKIFLSTYFDEILFW